MSHDYAALFEEVRAPSRPSAAQAFSDEQRAVLDLPADSSVVLKAGAGSGKTRVLVERAARLIEAGRDPARIALVSFTRKSATELGHRLLTRLKDKKRLPVSTTLHALALKFATQQGPIDLRPELALEVLPQLKRELGSGNEMSDKDLMTTLGRYRESMSDVGTFGLAAIRLCELLIESGADDFTSILEFAAPLDGQRFSHLLVDESQDLSPLQRRFLDRLLAPGGAIWYVGDDDQSIFAFRGAEGGLLQVLTREVGQGLALSTNWRCPTLVVDAANKLMSCAPGRDVLTWRAGKSRRGHVEVFQAASVAEEVAQAAATLAGKRDARVLARTNKALEPFAAAGLPVATVHEAKGLEWSTVWVAGCSAGSFPLAACDLDEERRLFYVALTRSMDELYLSWTKKPSCFLEESGLT